MVARVLFGDALALGLASGPACLAACGPVLVPSLLVERAGVWPHLRTIAVFLGTRLCGYLLFAAVAWEAGALASMLVKPHPHLIGLVYLLMALVLAWYAYKATSKCAANCSTQNLVTIGKGPDIQGAGETHGGVAAKQGITGIAMLGFLTGMNFCPPFVIAGIRAAELGSLQGALLFFAVFFAGTSLWFVPFAGLGCVVRNQGLITVARMTMGLVAVYYAALGIYMLQGR